VAKALFSNIVWSIPIPIRGYSFIAGEYNVPGSMTFTPRSEVKNHTFFNDGGYSLRITGVFGSINGLLIH